MLSSPGYFRMTRYLVFAVILILCVRLYFHRNPTRVQDASGDNPHDFQDEKKKLFIADYLEAGEVGGELDGRELAKLCQSKSWHPEEKALIVSCEPIPGGVGEVKNGALNCVRFAIEIGAQLILPRIALRSISDISNLHGSQQSKGNPLDYMFSIPKLVSSLETYCPQLKIHKSLDALYDRPSLLKALDVNIQQFALLFHSYDGIPTTVVAEPQKINEFVTTHMNSQMPLDKRHYPVRVHLQNTLFTWPLREVGNDKLRADMSNLLRLRDDIRTLAASALYNLVKRYSLAIPHPTAKGLMQSLAETTINEDDADDSRGRDSDKKNDDSRHRQGIIHSRADEASKGFIGIHLRTEKDARDANGLFPGYNDQVAYFFAYLSALLHSSSSAPVPPDPPAMEGTTTSSRDTNTNDKHQPIDDHINNNNNSKRDTHTNNNKNNIVYLATGLTATDTDIRNFRARAAQLNATVLLKRDLLDASEITALNRLTWDQRALVDYEMLLRAETVLGIVESSFAWNIALRRAQAYGGNGNGIGKVDGDTSEEDRAAFKAKPGTVADPVTGLKEPLIMWRDRWTWLFGKVDRAVSMYLATWP